ncbi:MAG: dienelactone hydrolase family protein [Gemmataceae bacterium]|nr:dienelactone hydrolase family protein [Gemmataceae bacterium]
MRSLLPALALSLLLAAPAAADPLPDTKPLTLEGDLAAQMVAGIDKYLMRELEEAHEKRKDLWNPDYASPDAYEKSVEPNRARLRKALGVVDPRVPFMDPEFVATLSTSPLVGEGDGYKVYAVRWPVLEGVDAEGLLLEPKGKPRANVIAIPDADWTPEMLVGLAAAVPKESQYARRLAENGCRVLVPTLIDRKDTWSGNEKLGRMTNQPHREFIYRMAFEMGRHVIGYEIQKVLAGVDWFAKEKDHAPIGAIGHGEGGLLAFYSGALDTRIDTTLVGGYYGPRERVWEEPIYRNVWNIVREFGDAEVAVHLYLPRFIGKDRTKQQRHLLIEDNARVEVAGPPMPQKGRAGAAPGRLSAPNFKANLREYNRIDDIFGLRKHSIAIFASDRTERSEKLYSDPWMQEQFLKHLTRTVHDDDTRLRASGAAPKDSRGDYDSAPRQKRQFDQLVAFTQKLMRDSEMRRQEFAWSKLDPKSSEKREKAAETLRNHLWEEVIGKLPVPTEPANPRTRQIYDEPKWKGYEVVLDLYPDVFAYGILLIPKDIKGGEKRPVVVCQHGLEGRPVDVCNPKEKTRAYNSYGATLADRGYVVFAPQNCYIGRDNFRVLQRKANPLKLSLFSFIIRQHERTLEWLAGLPFVDGERIGFYGLSYGGKTAMRVPALLPRYKLSICSGDFNEWIWKNASVDFRGSYMFTGEYEMPEFDLGNTFNYAEMAALIAPRPFMVERGHDDGVGIDEWVAYEFAKVQRMYVKMGLPDRTTIEWFNGGHEINGKGTFEFLDRHLKK